QASILFGQKALAGGQLVGLRRARKDLLERGLNEMTVGIVIRSKRRRKTPRQQTRLTERECAVGDSQGLLRNHAFRPAVTLVDIGVVEEHEKRHLLFVGVAEID